MKKVFDFRWIICMSIWIIAAIGCAISFSFEESVETILYTSIVLIFLFVSLLFSPIYIELDKKGMTIHFLFGFYEKANWDTIWKIERQCVPSDIRYCRVYGEFYGKSAFFTSPKIPYSRKVKKHLKQYSNVNFT